MDFEYDPDFKYDPDSPPRPPVWYPGESIQAFERALDHWLIELKEWARHHHHHRHHNQAVGIQISIGGEMASVTLSVDAANEVVSSQWVDDKGDVTTVAPTGPDGNAATVAYASSDTSVLDVDDVSGALTLNKAGTATLTATAVDSTGAALAGFGVASADVTLTPGAAAGLEIAVTP